MKTARRILLLICCLPAIFSSPLQAVEQTAGPVRAIFFLKNDCPDCETLRLKFLPELKAKMGERLEILSLNTSCPEAGTLYLQALLSLGIPLSNPLPLVILGKQHWSGLPEITGQLPPAVDSAVSAGGSDWPPLQGLSDLLNRVRGLETSECNRWYITTEPETAAFIFDRLRHTFRRDLVGNSYSLVLLAAMFISLAYSAAGFIRNTGKGETAIAPLRRWLIMLLLILGIAVAWQLAEIDRILQGLRPAGYLLSQPLVLLILVAMLTGFLFSFRNLFGDAAERIVFWQRWFPLLLLVIGMTAAGYLAWTEFMQTEAVCGAVGDCNAVQQSEYARLCGLVSIAALGICCNLLILLAWAGSHYGPSPLRDFARLSMWSLLFLGVCFFVYLTFLEPFVIGATCLWCLTAASAMTLQLLAAPLPRLRPREEQR